MKLTKCKEMLTLVKAVKVSLSVRTVVWQSKDVY